MPVWEPNLDAVRLFAALGTQWRCVVLGGGMEPHRLIWLGIDYAAIAPVMALLGLSEPTLFDDLRLMEDAAIGAFAEAAA